MVRITVDGTAMEASGGELLIAACERNGVYIPRFCYHERMESVGMCRMCLVEVDTGRGMALQPSCMVSVADNMEVRTDSDVAKKAQNGVLEFLLINHPLDCPVCDKGGECPLQDQTMACGPGESRFVEEKRHFEKPIAISSTVYLDRERCILCDRCTRFADQVSGDPLIHFMGRGARSEVNTFPGDPFASYFSGNTVQICPVGALTAVPYRFKARPWDLTEAVSTAWIDSVGARISVQVSRDRVLRLLGVDADAVNWGWLSDKERFAFEALNSEDRLRKPLVRRSIEMDNTGKSEPVLVSASWNEAITQTADALSAADTERIGVLGGARCTNEAQYAWAKLFKGVLGTDNVDSQLEDGLDAKLLLGLPRATINDACRPGSTVVLLGPDLKEELGSLYLRLRHAVTKDSVTLVEIAPCDGGLSSLAAYSLRPRQGETSILVRSLVVTALSFLRSDSSNPASVAGLDGEKIAAAARALARAPGGVTVILGRPSLAESAEEIEESAATLRMLPFARFLYALRRGNVHGAIDAGLAPGLLPGRRKLLIGPATSGTTAAVFDPGAVGVGTRAVGVGTRTAGSDTGTAGFARTVGAAGITDRLNDVWPRIPETVGFGARDILSAAADGELDVLVLLGVDPLNDFVDRDLAERGLRGAAFVVAVDMFVNDSSSLAADVVLAAAGPTESEGTFTNLEGRVSLMSHNVTQSGTARPDWMIATELAVRLAPENSTHLMLDSPQAIRSELAQVSEIHESLTPKVLADNPVEGVLLTGTRIEPPSPRLGLARRPVVAHGSDASSVSEVSDSSSGLRLIATRTMYDDGVMLRHCPSSRNLAEVATARVHPVELERLNLVDGVNVRISSDCGHLDAVLSADAGVPEGSLAVAWLAPGAAANTLITVGAPFTLVKVTVIAQ